MLLMNLFSGQQWRNRQRTDLKTWGEMEGMFGREFQKEEVICITMADSC